jgi:hypothetical protein
MLFIGPGDDERTDDHEGYVAGRYRNGAFSDIWTDVAKCAERTFTAYAPACECGWRGALQKASDDGYSACQRIWLRDHFESLDLVRPILAKLNRPLQMPADFLTLTRRTAATGRSVIRASGEADESTRRHETPAEPDGRACRSRPLPL